MKKAIASEMILTVGVLVAVGIALLQLRQVFYGQQKFAKEEVVVTFANDLKSIVDKAIAVTGEVNFSYDPPIKKYTLDVRDNRVMIHDKISGKNTSFVEPGLGLIPNRLEDSKRVYVEKLYTTRKTDKKKPKDLRFGMLGGESSKKIGFFDDLGVTLTETYFSWDLMEPDQDEYSQEEIEKKDRKVRMFEEHGIELVGTLSSTALWASENPGECGSDQLKCKISHDRVDDFKEFVRFIVNRYDSIDRWVFWNEPEMYRYMSDPDEYVFWLNHFYDAVKEVNPTKKVAASTLEGWSFLKDYYDRGKFDAISYHPYQKDPDNPLSIKKGEVERIRENMIKKGDSEKTIWLTEFGWRSDVFGEDGQASRLEDALDWILDQDYIEVSIVFTLEDLDGEKWGLVTRRDEFRKKPAYYKFKEIVESHRRVEKEKDLFIYINDGTCTLDNVECQHSIQCCSGYCWGGSPGDLWCHDRPGGVGVYANDDKACGQDALLNENTGRCDES